MERYQMCFSVSQAQHNLRAILIHIVAKLYINLRGGVDYDIAIP